MKSEKKIEGVLREHELRLSRLEALVKHDKKKTATSSATHTKQRLSLTDHIAKLRETGFFTQPKIADEVHKKLQNTYPCEASRVDVALFRLAKRRELRKATKKR